jgi:mono/diheme cytochrome c family protein
MNALQAVEKLQKYRNQIHALSRIIQYVEGDRDFEDDVYILRGLYDEICAKCHTLATKLESIEIGGDALSKPSEV